MSYSLLAGMRVVDFGIITAGASTSAILADLGAEVIKIEGPGYIDSFRVWTGVADAEQWWNASPHYAFTNRNKRSFCVDIKNAEGRELALELVRRSDLVVENFRTGVMDRLGLGFEILAAANPGIVLASISSQGATGPEADSVSFGSTLEASSGMSSLIRSAAGKPLISGHALNYPDQIVSLSAAGTILCALLERENGAGPIHLDLSQRELTAYMLGEFIGAGDDPSVAGSVERGPGAPAALQLVAATGDGRWLALTVPSAEAARRVCAGLGLAEPLERGALSERIGRMTADEAGRRLQAAGASVEVARTAIELARGDSEYSPAFGRDPAGGAVKGLPWRCGVEAAGIDRAAPDLGADNRYVACEVLGLDPGRYRELCARGVLATEPRSRSRGDA